MCLISHIKLRDMRGLHSAVYISNNMPIMHLNPGDLRRNESIFLLPHKQQEQRTTVLFQPFIIPRSIHRDSLNRVLGTTVVESVQKEKKHRQ